MSGVRRPFERAQTTRAPHKMPMILNYGYFGAESVMNAPGDNLGAIDDCTEDYGALLKLSGQSC